MFITKAKPSQDSIEKHKQEQSDRHVNLLERLREKALQHGQESIWAEMLKEQEAK